MVYAYTHTHTHTMEYYSAKLFFIYGKNPKILPFTATWMDFEVITLSEISQTQKDKYCMMSLMCVC